MQGSSPPDFIDPVHDPHQLFILVASVADAMRAIMSRGNLRKQMYRQAVDLARTECLESLECLIFH